MTGPLLRAIRWEMRLRTIESRVELIGALLKELVQVLNSDGTITNPEYFLNYIDNILED